MLIFYKFQYVFMKFPIIMDYNLETHEIIETQRHGRCVFKKGDLLMNTISSVYNYYMPDQVRKHQTTKYDTHKKSELRSLYNSIVKMSKESPVYIYDKSKQACEYVVNLKEEARELKNTLSALSADGEAGSLYGHKVADSSNEEAVSVKYLGSRADDEDLKGFMLNVDNLAKPQVNTGRFLSPGRLKIMPDDYSFNIQYNGLSYEFKFRVSHDDTNKGIQNRLASLINKSNIGIDADVVTNEDGFTALTLTSKSTGTNNGHPLFRVTDDSSSYEIGAVTYFGLNQISQESEDAVFRVNSEEHISSTNTFTINEVFELALHETTEEDDFVLIGFKPDIETVGDNIREMANKYNSMIRLSGSYSGEHIRNNILQRNISSVTRQHGNALESLGLQLENDGAFRIDEQLLNQSLTEDIDETIDSLLNFRTDLTKKIDEVMLNPMDYVDKKIVAYPNPGKTFANPYVTSIYSGMLFNSYC